MCAGLGLDATGVDLASAALHAAEEKARDRGRAARFLLWDGRRLADLGESFDTVLDRGLFHIFDQDDRRAFVDSLGSVVVPGGRPCQGSSKAGRGTGMRAARRNSKGAPRASPSARPNRQPAPRSRIASTSTDAR